MEIIKKIKATGIFFLMILCQVAYGGQSAGAYLEYECYSTDLLKVRLVFFSECTNSAPPPQQQKVTVRSGGYHIDMWLDLQGTAADITPVCPNETSPCDGGYGDIGLKKYVYEGLFMPPVSPFDKFTFSHRSLRFTGGMSADHLYLTATYDPFQHACNSPRLVNVPPVYVCINSPTHYNPGFIDPDGDSLYFSLITCLSNDTIPTNMPPPQTSGIDLDPHTGMLTFTTTVVHIGYLCMKVEKFRNGIKTGETIFDFMVLSQSCSNPPPVASGIDNSPVYDTTVCPGESLSFTIYAHDPNPFQNVEISWNEGISWGSLDIDTANSSALFSGTAPSKPGHYYFTVTVTDDGCPYVNQATYAYSITVWNEELEIEQGDSLFICKGSSWMPVVHETTAFTTYLWEPATGIDDPTLKEPVFTPSEPTIYTLTATNQRCQATAMLSVFPEDPPALNIVKQDATQGECDGIAIIFPASNHPPFTYQWSTGDSVAYIDELCPGVYYLTVTDTLGCIAQDSVEIFISTGIGDMATEFSISLYPNPANSAQSVSVEINSQLFFNASIEVLEMTGRRVAYSQPLKILEGNLVYTLDTKEIPPGIYLVQLVNQDNGTIVTKKMVLVE